MNNIKKVKCKNSEYKISNIDNYEELVKQLIYYNNYFNPVLSDMVTDIKEYAKKLFINAKVVQICNKQNEQLGMIAFYANDKIKNIGFITLIVVDNKYANKGIGSILIKYCEEYCKICKMKKVMLEVYKNNKAIHFYQKHNYYIIQENNKTYYMEKDI